MQAGHTKNELDQRFSSVARLLSDAGALEDDDEFLEYLQKNLRPFQGREVICEHLSGTRDFQQWFETADMHVRGLTATKLEPEANHLWRFVRRQDHPEPQSIECYHEDWKAWPPHPDDVILCLKHYISSPVESQAPQLFMPACLSERLTTQALLPAVRNVLPPRQLKEFRKTAQLIGQHPWNLFKGEAWLRKLCDENEAGFCGQPPVLQALFESRCREATEDPVVAQPAAPTPAAAPRAVRVQKRVLKRPAAARPAAADAAGANPEQRRAKARARARPAAAV